MWKEGLFVIDGVELFYQAKVFDEPSELGINGGRISKLAICATAQNKPCWHLEIVGYSRGWYHLPNSNIAKEALEYVLNLYS